MKCKLKGCEKQAIVMVEKVVSRMASKPTEDCLAHVYIPACEKCAKLLAFNKKELMLPLD